jgi:hypothetical protein
MAPCYSFCCRDSNLEVDNKGRAAERSATREGLWPIIAGKLAGTISTENSYDGFGKALDYGHTSASRLRSDPSRRSPGFRRAEKQPLRH